MSSGQVLCLHAILHSMASTCHQQSSSCAQLVEDLPGVSLALSLHAPNQVLRQSIVPSARAYKLDKLMAAIDTYREKTGQKVGILFRCESSWKRVLCICP